MADFTQTVMHLHEIARQIEKEIGTGQLSEDIRNCADRLHVLTSARPVKVAAN